MDTTSQKSTTQPLRAPKPNVPTPTYAGPRPNTPSPGFTLVESVVILGVFVLIVSIGFEFIIQAHRAQSFGFEQVTATDEAKKGMETMVAELREANLGDNGAYAIESAGPTSITFYSDTDTDVSREKITFAAVGDELQRTIIEPTGNPPQYESQNATTTVLTRYLVDTDIFAYFNGDHPIDTVNNPLPEPVDTSDIRLVHITLRVDPNSNQSPQTRVLESDIQLRNLKDNYRD